MNETIFVNLASYKDPELQNTVETLIKNAVNHKRLSIAVCQQERPDSFINFQQQQVQNLRYNYLDSQGVCWARRKAQELYNNQTYFLQIDSHIVMVERWDEIMIDQIKQAKQMTNNKVVFSAYPAGYQMVDGNREFNDPVCNRTVLRKDDIFKFHCGEGLDSHIDSPVPSPFLNAGFMFGDGVFNRICKYDPEIYFEGEELLNTVKAFTHGFDLFNPSVHMCWHQYKLWNTLDRSKWPLHHSEEDDQQRTVRHWERNEIAVRKLKEIFSGQRPQELGTVKTIQDYENYIGRSLLKDSST
jgi:hypothetical protein